MMCKIFCGNKYSRTSVVCIFTIFLGLGHTGFVFDTSKVKYINILLSQTYIYIYIYVCVYVLLLVVCMMYIMIQLLV